VDNLSFFQQLISKLKQRRDVDLEDDSFRIQELCDLSLSILNRSTEGKSHASQVYPGKVYIPPYYKLAEGFKVTQLFLSPNVKISEKNARKVTSSTPEKKQSTPIKSPKKKAINATPKKTPKKNATPKKKTPKKGSKKKEPVESRTKLKRGAKKVETYEENESEDKMEEEEEEKSEESEEEKIPEPKSTLNRKRKNKI
jgi:outer membrane biosynthesis protein TonB